MFTVLTQCLQNFEWPSRVQSDDGGENVGVWNAMEERRGPDRGSCLVGTSTHDKTRELKSSFRIVTHMFYYTFQSIEEAGLLERSIAIHMFAPHLIFLPRINRTLESFVLRSLELASN